MGAAEQGGQGHHIKVALRLAERLQIVSGGGAGGGRGVRALVHGVDEQAGVQALIVDVVLAAHADGQRDRAEHRVRPHLGGQVTAAVNNDGKAHIHDLLI